MSQFLYMKCIKAPFVLCHNTTGGFEVLDFFQPPTGANVSLKRANLLQNIACFWPMSLGNFIVFFISTDIATSCSAH